MKKIVNQEYANGGLRLSCNNEEFITVKKLTFELQIWGSNAT